ncbi:MAG: hypothetical protein LLG00_05120 [Planctomycetaceae bacterium]|nr:hypothetical protein [Planctomycetaceae bacterium]
MHGKQMFRRWIGAAVIGAAVAATCEASPPWNNMLSLGGVKADPEKNYTINESNGPWMIMACTFSGDGAEKQAKELVHELRKRYRVPAYCYCAQYDPGAAEGRGSGLGRHGNPAKWKYSKYRNEKDKEKQSHPEIVEHVVLVGNYATADDSEAQATLRTIKYALPACLEVKDGKSTNQTLVDWRQLQRQVYEKIGSERKTLGPMRHAFITTNPMLPPEYFNSPGVDEEVVALNKGVPYSLLECPGRYTVKVATFTGAAEIDATKIRAIEDGRNQMGSQLVEAAKKADTLAAALREKGYEAYQYHTRYTSIVTVGSFESAGTLRPDGQTIDPSPEVRRVMEVFMATTGDPFASDPHNDHLGSVTKLGNAVKSKLGNEAVALRPKYCVGVPFDVMPAVMPVPKRSMSMALRNEQ